MQTSPYALPSSILDLYAQVSTTRRLTHTDKVNLESALLKNSVAKEEELAIRRLLYALRRGYFQLVDG